MAPSNAPKLPSLQILNPKPGMAVYISILYNIYILLGIRLRISEDFKVPIQGFRRHTILE